MRLFWGFILIIGLVSVPACKTGRHFFSTTNSESSKVLTSHTVLSDTVSTNLSIARSRVLSDSSIMVITTIEYSKPDSNGKQYPERKTVAEIKTRKKGVENTSVSQTENKSSTRQTDVAELDHEKANTATTKDIQTGTDKTSLWLIVSALLVVLIILIIIKLKR
jgi:hypothetical protein